MKKIIFALFFILQSVCLFANSKCYITITANDCINCYAGISFLDKLNTNIEKCFVIKQKDADYLTKFLAENDGIKNLNYTTLISDSLFNVYNKKQETSMYHIVKNNINILSGELKDFLQSTGKINKLTNITLQNITKTQLKIKVNVKLSDRIDVVYDNDRYIVIDYLLSKALVINTTTNDSNEIYFVLKKNDLEVLTLLKNNKLDTNTNKALIPLLNKLNKNNVHYDAACINKDTLYILADIPHVFPSGKDTFVSKQY